MTNVSAKPVAPLQGGERLLGRGFTLIELLVVISIVAALMALLLPSLAAARQVARDKACMARVRSIYQLTEVYRNDWNQWYMTDCLLTGQAKYSPPEDMWFYLQLAPYLNVATQSLGSKSHPQNNMLMCPASAYSPAMALAEARNHVYAGTYYGNYWITARWGFNPSSVTYPMRRDVLSPDRTILLGEVKGTTWTRFGHNTTAPTVVVYNHALATSHMVTVDGRVKATDAVDSVGLALDELVIQ